MAQRAAAGGGRRPGGGSNSSDLNSAEQRALGLHRESCTLTCSASCPTSGGGRAGAQGLELLLREPLAGSSHRCATPRAMYATGAV